MENIASAIKHTTRRQMLATAAAGASGMFMGRMLQGGERTADVLAKSVAADPRVQGPFLILSTPFTKSGDVDYDALAKEARFVDWCGLPGMIWPQSNDSIELLTKEEKIHGMEVLAKASRNLHTALCLGVQGKNTDEMLFFAEYAERLAPAAIISRPPDKGKKENDLDSYWRALAAVAKRPVIIQTSGGTDYKGPVPSVRLLIELAQKFPHFGYVKEEAGPDTIRFARIHDLAMASPPILRVFSAHGGRFWLYESRLGAEGVITERPAYADIFTRIWKAMQKGDLATARDAYSKFLLMINLLSGLRGGSLYLLKKRGVFKTMVSRHYAKDRTIPSKPKFSELKLSNNMISEIEYRFEALKPYLKRGSLYTGPA